LAALPPSVQDSPSAPGARIVCPWLLADSGTDCVLVSRQCIDRCNPEPDSRMSNMNLACPRRGTDDKRVVCWCTIRGREEAAECALRLPVAAQDDQGQVVALCLTGSEAGQIAEHRVEDILGVAGAGQRFHHALLAEQFLLFVVRFVEAVGV